MKALLQKRSVQIGLLIASMLFAGFCIYDFAHLVRQTHTRALVKEFGVAIDQMQKSPPGIERVEDFIKALRKIDPGCAPAEVKIALQDYILALQQSVEASKGGQRVEQYDLAIAAAKQRLIESVGKYR